MEEWKRHPSYPVEVSNLGQVRNAKTKYVLSQYQDGTYQSGENCATHKLCDLCVEVIRRLYESEMQQEAIAKLFGITKATVSEITKGRSRSVLTGQRNYSPWISRRNFRKQSPSVGEKGRE